MRRFVNVKHELPPNLVFREIGRSDGDRDTWPKNTTRIVDSDGQVNYMQYVPSDEGIAINWRVQVGQALANAFNWPKGFNYVLEDWPANYRMFIHHKGPVSNPRKDVYLFGSTNSPKFRSVPELIPHAIWLSNDMKGKCQCKYCSKTKQREITSNMGERGIIEKMSPGPSSSPSQASLPERRPRLEGSALRNQAVYAAVHKAKLRKPSTFVVPKHHAPVEKVTGLEAALHDNTALLLRRWYRIDELVWVELKSPIAGPKGNGDVINAWPAIVEDSWTRFNSSEKSEDSITPSKNGSYPDYDPETPPQTVTHYNKYKLRLLATSCSMMARDHQVLPYQAYLPPTELIYALQDVPLSKIRLDTEYTTNFTPVITENPEETVSPPPSFEDSIGPYALAIQIGSQIAGFWGLTGDSDFKFSFKSDAPPPPSGSSISSSAGYTLQDAIVAASNSNAYNAGPQTSYESSDISGNRYMTVEELNRTKATTLGAPKDVGHTFTQKNFHGLWWGAERIWTGDLLRLKIGRNAIARDGAPHILAPSPAGPSALLHSAQNGDNLDPNELGARSRGVFMRLDALFTVEVGEGRKRNECRAAGTLYELADIDWVNPSEDTAKETSSTPLGTGSTIFAEASNGMSNALPQHSSLKSIALPNPNPAIPIAETAPQMLSEILPRSSVPEVNGVYKPPIPVSHYNLPQPPTGFKFRPILDPGYEAVFSLTLLSGRYYPGILGHPLLMEAIHQALTPEGKIDPQTSHLWALEGLEPGFSNSMDPIRYKKDRPRMVVDAEVNARAQLTEHFSSDSEQADGDVSMEIGNAEQSMEVDPVPNDQMQVDS